MTPDQVDGLIIDVTGLPWRDLVSTDDALSHVLRDLTEPPTSSFNNFVPVSMFASPTEREGT